MLAVRKKYEKHTNHLYKKNQVLIEVRNCKTIDILTGELGVKGLNPLITKLIIITTTRTKKMSNHPTDHRDMLQHVEVLKGDPIVVKKPEWIAHDAAPSAPATPIDGKKKQISKLLVHNAHTPSNGSFTPGRKTDVFVRDYINSHGL